MLPFLVKVLAADEPLSLQAHPSAEQAVEGYLREERLGIPVSSPVRNYRDTCAQARVVGGAAAVRGAGRISVRRPAPSELLRALAVSDLDPFIDLLNDQSDADGLRALFTTWITAPQPDIDVLVPAVLDGAIQYVSSGATEFAAEAKTVLELGERYPGDAGVLAALLLNRITLAPGEAIFLPAGNLHTYLRGFAVEVMANSDNVLRGGLTPKHVDVPELLRVLDFTPTPEAQLRAPRIRREGLGADLRDPDRRVRGRAAGASTATISATRSTRRRSHEGPQILLCIEGSHDGARQSPGRSRWTAAWPPGWGPTTARSGWWRASPPSCSGRLSGCDGAALVALAALPAFLAEPQPHVVRRWHGRDPRRRDHVQTVEQREPAQKPFARERDSVSAAPRNWSNSAPDGSLPPRFGLGRRVVEGHVADGVHHPHREGGLGGRPG